MTKEERAAKWDSEFISCKRHPQKKCLRSLFIRSNMQICSGCLSKQPGFIRYRNSDKKRKVNQRYFTSEKGKAARRLRDARYRTTDKGAIRTAWYYERKLHG